MKTFACAVAFVCGTSALLAQTPGAGGMVGTPVTSTMAVPPDMRMGPAAVITVGSRVGGDLPSGYDDGGRRDPFMTLITPKRAASNTPAGRARTGLGSVAVADVTVRGIVRSGAVMLAILETPGKQSFVARPKDRLLDGTVQSIERDGVLFAEQPDLGGPAETIRKALRSPGEEVR